MATLTDIPYYLDIIVRKMDRILGKMNVIRAHAAGIRIGKGSSFWGSCYFSRYPGTSISIGENCRFRSRTVSNLIGVDRRCMISTQPSPFSAKIEIGKGCGFSGTVIGAFKYIKIGNDVKCGANTLITDSDWHLEDRRSGTPSDVIIGDNVWLGTNVVVLKGVSIGANTIIGANSVVSKSIPANVIAAGNPCKVLKPIAEGEIEISDIIVR